MLWDECKLSYTETWSSARFLLQHDVSSLGESGVSQHDVLSVRESGAAQCDVSSVEERGAV